MKKFHGFGQINFEKYRIPINKTKEKIKIDGILDEKTWKEVNVGKDFSMITPLDTGKATQFSEVRVAFNDEFIYIAMIFFNNSIQGEYVVETLKRDLSFGKNDNFLVAIDPFNNQSTGFAFGLNAYGAQWDGTMYDGRSVDLNWDTKFFNKKNSKTAYWAGFLMADGSLSKNNNLEFSQKIQSKNVLEAFCKDLKIPKKKGGSKMTLWDGKQKSMSKKSYKEKRE